MPLIGKKSSLRQQTVNKVMLSQFSELQQQTSSVGRMKIPMSKLTDKNEIQSNLDFEEKRPAIEGRKFSNAVVRFSEELPYLNYYSSFSNLYASLNYFHTYLKHQFFSEPFLHFLQYFPFFLLQLT